MKNILVVVPSLKFGGGAEKAATKIGSEFYKSGYNVKYFTFYNDEVKYDSLGEEYCLNEKLNGNIISKFLKLFTRAYKIKNFCKKEKIDTIFSHMEDANFSAILSKFFGNKAKLCIMVHHSISDYGKGIYYRMIRVFYKYADNIVVLTKFEKDNLIKLFNVRQEKIKVIPNFIDIDKIESLRYQDLGEYKKLLNNKFNFITVGRLNKIKNQKLMIKCFNELNKENSNIQLIILGEGELRKDLEKLSGKNVHFLGNQENVFKFLNKSDCFLLTSISESFSISILEAMACGLPIISTSTQGPNEILDNGNYGIIIEDNNEKELYEAMKTMIFDNNARSRYARLSGSRVSDYSLKNIFKKRSNII